MEAIKLLMLEQAVLMFSRMQQAEEVPVWVYILFARDTSPDPQKFMTQHLNRVGDTGGLEQVTLVDIIISHFSGVKLNAWGFEFCCAMASKSVLFVRLKCFYWATPLRQHFKCSDHLR